MQNLLFRRNVKQFFCFKVPRKLDTSCKIKGKEYLVHLLHRYSIYYTPATIFFFCCRSGCPQVVKVDSSLSGQNVKQSFFFFRCFWAICSLRVGMVRETAATSS